MKTYTFDYELYWLYDRAYEGSLAAITVEVPDDYELHCPTLEEVKLKEIKVKGETATYLVSTFHTDLKVLEAKIKEDLDHDTIYETFVETMSDEISSEEKFIAWYETCTGADAFEPTDGKTIPITNITEALNEQNE